MAVSNQMLLTELKRLESRVNELAASIAMVCERIAGIEQWKTNHVGGIEQWKTNHVGGAHSHLQQQIENAQRRQERQGERLWRLGLQVANLAALLMVMAKWAGVW